MQARQWALLQLMLIVSNFAEYVYVESVYVESVY